jgi:hypothetical protein
MGTPVGRSVMKPLIAAFVVAAAAGLQPGSQSARAADLRVPAPVAQEAECGPCGCVHVSYDYHRELRSTYGVAFDPRNFDTTQPYYYFGPVRAYPRFWCDVQTAQYGKGKAPAPVVEAPAPLVTK